MSNAKWQVCAAKTNPSSSNFYLTYYSSGSSSTCKYCVVEYHKGNDSWAISSVASDNDDFKWPSESSEFMKQIRSISDCYQKLPEEIKDVIRKKGARD